MRLLLLLISFCFFSCASSLTPIQFAEQFPDRTTSRYYNQIQGKEAVANGSCRLLVENRKYLAPVGLTLQNDMKYGARGIDEWVQVDGGNAYILNNYEWVSVHDLNNDMSGTQLVLYFDTMNCK